MFQVIEKTTFYTARGDVRCETSSVVFESADPVECLAYRYQVSPNGHGVGEVTSRSSVSVSTFREDGSRFPFDELFRMVEGQEAYDAVMNGEAPSQNEAAWLKEQLRRRDPKEGFYQERVNRFRIIRHDELPAQHKAEMRLRGIDPDDSWSLVWSFETEDAANEQLASCVEFACSWETFKLVDAGCSTVICRPIW
jgi:hypothetical protein